MKISVVGVGMRSHAGVAMRMFQALADKGINIRYLNVGDQDQRAGIGYLYRVGAAVAPYCLRARRRIGLMQET